MKRYVLPTLISLALAHSSVLAEEVADSSETPLSTIAESSSETSTKTESAPSTTTESSDKADSYQEMMKKHQAHREYMQTQMQKLRETDDPEEYQRLITEMQQRRLEIMQEMWDNNRRPSWGGPPPWVGSDWGAPRWGGPSPAWGHSPNWGGPPPAWGHWNEPKRNYFDRAPRGGYGRMPNRFRSKTDDSFSKIEQRLNNIEKMLQELIDSSKKTTD